MDLLDPSLAFTGKPEHLAEFALRAGITDTVLEGHVGTPVRKDRGTPAVFAALPADAQPTLYTTAAALPSDLPPGVQSALRVDVEAGYAVFAPKQTVDLTGGPIYGWWSFIGGTSYALGKIDLGSGGALAELVEVSRMAIQIIPFIKFYGNCIRCIMGSVATAVVGSGVPGHSAGSQSSASASQAQFDKCMLNAICVFAADFAAAQLGLMAGNFNETSEAWADVKFLRAKFTGFVFGQGNKHAGEDVCKALQLAMSGG